MSIIDEVRELEDFLIKTRRIIHQNPELGFEEKETAALICKELDNLNIPYTKEIAITGVIGIIEGKKGSGKTLLLRADMDALPLPEDTNLEFKSNNNGIFHACGHDSHVACLLTTAKLLKKHENDFAGKVMLVFQPAEEGSMVYDPTGKISGGALPMIMEAGDIIGNKDNPKIDGALALHVISSPHPRDVLGKIGIEDGPFTGSSDELLVKIKGKGGHASAPHTAVDPVYIASQVNVALQGWLTRTLNPMKPVVITFGKIVGGLRNNIISETCEMEGTLRTLDEDVRDQILGGIGEFVSGIAEAYGAQAEVTIMRGYPVGHNSKEMNDLIRESVTELYGNEAIYDYGAILGSEDFFEFGFRNKVPIAMFWLGGSNVDKGMVHENHSNYFDYDEEALVIGTAVLFSTTMKFLAS
ncbi:MAG: amidohydrolase [Candidatus Heimdallarchaeota archaeon]|nr:amidohydrolase [Candidatus Heimdallarchaeota archaeon]